MIYDCNFCFQRQQKPAARGAKKTYRLNNPDLFASLLAV
jgi:hypothetical protein